MTVLPGRLGADQRRALMFVVADKAMQQILEGFLARDDFARNIGCAEFDIDSRLGRDITVAPGHDPELCKRAGEIARPYQRTHRRVIVMIDNDWRGSPGAIAIAKKVDAQLDTTGWQQFSAIVLDPEIEAWLWQPDGRELADALRLRSNMSYRELLAREGLWPDECRKPPDPKKAREFLSRRRHIDPSNAVLKRAGETVSVRHCQDAAFQRLRATLCEWFPAGERERAR